MDPGRRTQDREQGRAGARVLVMLAALVAVLIQAFVIQTHIHETAFAAAAYERTSDHERPGHTHVSATHDQAGCITCIAFATTGVSLTPDAFTLVATQAAATEAATLAIRRAPRAISYSWQSRAPPIAL